MSKYEEYGPKAVLCCRGQVFALHKMNEENPEEFWSDPDDGYYKKFFGQDQPDRQVQLIHNYFTNYDYNVQIHFVHACASLFPRQLLLEASIYKMPSPELILVDDYWLSFVLSHHLKVPLWKIQGDDIFHLTLCADDAEKALWKQPKVKEQQTNMYIYHMRQGWPDSMPLGYSENIWK